MASKTTVKCTISNSAEETDGVQRGAPLEGYIQILEKNRGTNT
jgi:hypothetical protein